LPWRIIISISLLIFLGWKVGFKTIWGQITQINPWILLLGIILTILASALNAWKWKILLKGQGIKISYSEALKLFLIGFFFNHFLLTGVGDLKRIWDLGKARNKLSQVLLSVLIERWSGMVMLFVWVIFGLALGVQKFPKIALFLWASLVVLTLTMFLPLLIARLQKLSGPEFLIKKLCFLPDLTGFYRRPEIYTALWLSFPPPFLVALVYWFLGCGLNLEVAFINYIYFAPLILAASFLPISASGLGVQEAAFLLLFSNLRVPAQTILSLSLLAQIAKLGAALVGGLLYLLEGSTRRTPRAGNPITEKE